MAVDWTFHLTRVLTLKRGWELRTLGDAPMFSCRFGSVRRDASLEHAIWLLLQAVVRNVARALTTSSSPPD
jgi:hypothetical protein